jgi:hypothetical protein
MLCDSGPELTSESVPAASVNAWRKEWKRSNALAPVSTAAGEIMGVTPVTSHADDMPQAIEEVPHIQDKALQPIVEGLIDVGVTEAAEQPVTTPQAAYTSAVKGDQT